MRKIEKYAEFIISFLDSIKSKAAVSHVLTEAINVKFGVKVEYAKKILSRLAQEEKICSSRPLKFKDGAYAYSTRLNRSAYRALLSEYNKTLNAMLNKIEYNKGIISFLEIFKLAGSMPICKEGYEHLSIERDIADIKYFYPTMITVNNGEEDFLLRAELAGQKDDLIEDLKKREMVNVRLLSLMLKYCQSVNLIDGGRPLYRGVGQVFKRISQRDLVVFDATAFTMSAGIKDDKKCLVVFDCQFFDCYTLDDLNGFVVRYERLRNSTRRDGAKQQRVIAILVANKIHKNAYSEAVKRGIICLETVRIFGKNFSRIADELIQKDITEWSVGEQAKILEIIEDSGQEDNLNQFKGIIFEVIVGRLVQMLMQAENQGYRMTFNEKICVSNKENSEVIDQCEIDILLRGESRHVAIECKSTKYPMTWAAKEIEGTDLHCNRFFVRTGGLLRKHFQEVKIDQCLIAANGFTQEAEKALEKRINGNGILPCLLSVTELIAKIKKHNKGILQETQLLEKFYMNQT